MNPAQRWKKKWLAGAAGLLSLLLVNSNSYAENVPVDGYVGLLLGASTVDHSIGTGLGFGLNAGYFFNEHFGLGAFLRSANHGQPEGAVEDVSSFIVGVEGLYRFTNTLPGLHVGAILGSTRFLHFGDRSTTNFAFGAKAAFDFLVSVERKVSLGAEYSLLFTKPADTTLMISSPMLTAKLWF